MSDEILISKDELDNLNERVKKLAVEKSYLQVFIHLMNEMSTVSGLENNIQKLLQIILGNIGGSNLIIYYLIDDEIFYADVLGEKKALEQIEDDIVKKVFETKELIEIQSDFTNTKLLGTEFTTASTWAFPLLVGNDLIGVLKIEDLYTGTADLHFHLPTFFSYAAHILKNEILGHTKLKSAFDQLTEENNLRKQAEEELKIINEELENRVEERTLELHHLNLQLEEELAVRQSADAQILKLNRILSVLSEINQAIVRIHDSGKILNEACRIAVENGKFQMAWIGMVNFQTNKVDVAASYGISGDYLENIDIDLTDEIRSNGPTGIAVKTGKHKISNNINKDESMLPWREKAIKYGYKSSASFPLLVFDKAIGAFNIYSDENDFFQEDDITLLDEMAKDISFALEFIQSENDRKQTELQLINSEREYRSLAENSPDNIVRYDRQCRAIYCNTKMIQTLSVKPEIMFGKTPLEFGAGGLEVDTEYEMHIRRVLENGESSDLEIVMPHSDGGLHNHLIRFVAERDTEGSIIGVLAIGQDITARKRAEESLRESEEKYRAVADYTYDWETWMDAKGNFIYVSPACERITGYSAGEFMDNPNLFNDIVFKDDSDELTKHKQLSEKDDSVHQKEFRITTKSGGVRWIEHICRSIFNSDGKWIGRRASNREITERKRDEALNASRLHLMNYAAVHSFDDFIEESLNVIEKFTESKISFYVFVEDDQQSVILQDWSTRTKAEFCKAEGRGFHYNISDAGVWIDCVIKRKAVIHNDYSSLPHRKGLPEGHAELIRELVVPVFRGDKIKAVVAVGNKAQNYTESDVESATLLASLSWEIAERKRSELSLRESERRLTEAQRIANIGYWERDFISNKIILSDESCRIFGLTQENYHIKLDDWHKQLLQLLLPEDKERVEKAFMDAVQNDIPYNLDYRIVRHDGELRHVHSEADVRRDSSGLPLIMLGMMQDITDRKRAEESIRESEMKLRVMFESSRDAIGVSKKGVHVFANPAYLKLFGFEKLEELVGKSILDCIASSHHQEIIQNVKRRAAGEETPSFYETRGRRTDGSEFDFEINVSSYELNGEEYTLANIRDITDRKLLEKALFFVAERGWQSGEESFFDSLAQFLGENLNMDYVIIDKLDQNPVFAETIALYAKGTIVPNMRYALKGTPCENVMGRQLCFYPQEVQKLFPEDNLLVEMGVECYIGIPLWDSSGSPIGLIALMNTTPKPEDSPAIHVLQLVATRAAAEMERERSDRNLKAREREYRTLAENIPNNIIRYDLDCRAVYLNHMLETIKYSNSAIIGESPSAKQFDGVKGIEEYNEKLKWVIETGAEEEMEMIIPDLEGNIHIHEVHFVAERNTNGEISGALAIGHDITERKQTEEERKANLHYFKSMDRINRALQGMDSLEKMMSEVLATVLSIFDSDRVWLFYPCDPDASMFQVPMEITKPEYPGAGILNVDVPMPSDMADNLGQALKSDEPITFVEGSDRPINKVSSEQFSVKSMILISLHPKSGKPWAFGMHQCSYARIWTLEEEKLFREIGRRLEDSLTSFIAHNTLKESEEKFRRLTENARDIIYRMSIPDGKYEYVSPAVLSVFGYSPEECYNSPMIIKKSIHPDWHKYFEEQWTNLLKGEMPPFYEYQIIHKSGEVRWLNQRNILVQDVSGNPIAIEAIVTDVTERKRNDEINTTRLSLLQFAATHSLDELLEETLNQAEKLTGSFIGFYHFVEDDQKTLTLQNWSTRTKAEFCKTEGKGLHYAIDAAGVWAECVYKRKPVVHNDYASLPNRKGMPEGHAELIRELVVPVLRSEKIKAVLGVGNKTSDYNEKDIEVISILADLTWEIAERKRAEEAVLKREAQLNEAQHLAHIGSWELNLSKNTLNWSDEIYRIFEIDSEKFGATYDAFLDTIHPDDREAVNFAYTNSLKTKTPYSIDHRLIFSNGRIKFVHEQCETFYDGDKPLRSIGTVQDITERKRTEQALRDTELKLTRFIANLPAFFFTFQKSSEGVFYFPYASPGIKTLYGLDPEDVREDMEPMHILAHPEDRPHIEASIDKAFKTLEPFNIEYRVCRPDMSERWLECRSIMVLDIDGSPIWHGIILDVTERKQTEEALKKSEAHYYQLFEDSPISLWEEDYSEVKKFIDHLKESGITDFRSFFDNHPEEVIKCATNMKVNSFNYASLELYKAEDKVSLLNGLSNVITDELLIYVKECFIALASGELKFYGEATLKDFTGEIKNVVISQSIAKEYENNWNKVIVSLIDITERNHAEEALQKSENLLNTTQQLTKVGGWEFDVKSRKSFWTEELYRIHEVPNDSSIDHLKQSLACYESDDRQILQDAFQRACEHGEPYDLEFPFTTYAGKHLWIRTTAQPVYEEDKVVRLVGNLMDITERKQAETALRESEWRFREIFDNVLDSLYLLEVTDDWHFRNLEMNPAFEKSTGLSRSQLVGKIIEETVPKEVAEAVNAKYRRCVEAGQPIEEEVELELPTGRRYFHSILIPARDEAGKIHRIVGISRDITDKKRAEDMLRESEERYRLLHENAGVGIGYYTTDGIVISFNNLAASQVSGKPEDFNGKSIYEIYSKSEADFYMNRIKLSSASESNIIYEDYINLPSGDKWFLNIFSRICDSQKNVIGIQIISQDITERKRAEAELKEQMDEINRFNRLMVGREEKMIELKKEINNLFEKEGKPKKYDVTT